MTKKIDTLADLTPDGENFNKHTEFGQKLLEDSLRKFGAGRSILVDKDGIIIAGNSTTETAAAIGMEDVIVVPTDGKKLVVVQRTDLSLDSPEGRELALADNMTALKGIDIDLEKVKEHLGDDLAKAWGMGIPEVQKQAQEDDFNPDSVPETVCKKGDIWKLGNHRLMCGDSTDAGSVALLMDGERADIAFTSPPYNMQATNIAKAFDSDKVKDSYGIKNGTYNEFSDNLSNDDYARLLNGALDCCLANADEVLFNIGILAASKFGIIDMLAAHKDKFSDILVWNKNNCIPLCLPTQIHLLNHICELIFCFSHSGTRAFSHSQWELGKMNNRIDVGMQSNNEYSKIHHATFPVALPAYIIEHFTETSILDTFGGTGTTLIAAEQLNRKCYMMELDPHYCDVIIARWEKLTGNKAERISDGN